MNYNYKTLSDKAYELHQKDQLDKAEKIYLHLLEMQPEDTNVLNLLGLLYISQKKEKLAINYLTKAFVLKKNAYIATNLAKAYYFNKEYTNALKIFNEALLLEPSEDIFYSLALTYKKMNDYTNAILNYEKAININPTNYKTYYNMALAYKNLENIDMAIYCAEKSVELCADDEEVYTLLSGFYEKKNEYKKAIWALKSAATINPKNHLYFYNLGVLYSRIKNKDEAVIAYNTAIMLNKNFVESYVNISTIYKIKDIKISISYLERAYSINPNEENVCLSLAQAYRENYENDKSIVVLNKFLENNSDSAEAYSLLATNYMDLCEYTLALDYSNKALSLSPKNKTYLHSKAIALKYLGNIAEAKEILESIKDKYGVSNQTLVTLGMMYLADRQFEKGMSLYRLRSKESKFKNIFKTKIWSPDIKLDKNQTILLYSDCGLGDTIMYCRYLNLLQEKVKNVILQTDKELVRILKDNFPSINIISKTEQRPPYDIVIPMMDIQLALNLDFSQIPGVDKYLYTTENTSILDQNKKKIGLFWQGNRKVFKNRSIDINEFKDLLCLSNTNFYSFQLDNKNNTFENIIDLSEYIKDYSDTASLLLNLDVLITIDSSIVHMAGALGVKTFLLLPKTAEWRWFDDKDNCSWYKSVKIFKQSDNSNWKDVISVVKNELIKL